MDAENVSNSLLSNETNANTEVECSEKVLSVFWKRGHLGAAYYNCENSQLHILNDVVDTRPDFNNLKSLLSIVEPSEVVTSRNVSDVFLIGLQSLLHQDESRDTSKLNGPSINLRLLPGGRSELNLEACKLKVLSLRMAWEPDDVAVEDHEMMISSLFDMHLECMVISVALLVRHLEKYMPQVLLSHSNWTVLALNYIRLDTVVLVDEITRRALQVFSPLQHPSPFLRGVGKPREGLSLLGLFGRCQSSNGTRRLREILAAPTRNLEILNARLDAIQFLILPQNQQIVSALKSSVSRVKHVEGILVRISRTHASVSNWQTLYSSIYNTILVGKICSSHAVVSTLFAQIAQNVTYDVHSIAHCIDKVVDFEESTRKNKFSVHAGIDKRLDKKRQLYSEVPALLGKVAELEMRGLPEDIPNCSIVCITELGYLLCVPAWLQADADTSLYHLPDFQVKFVVNKHVYYKTPRCAELDRILGDLVAQMSGIESEIMVLLMQFIRRRVPDILKAVSLIADLDCVLAFADVARQNNYVRPRLVSDPQLDIVGGRHPLQELCVDRFVPNDTHLNANSGLIKLLTGANASGKSVYLKQVAIIAYLAHVGSFVPAESATVGLLEHIRTRIQSIESCSMQMSAFFIDLKQMLQCIYNSSRNSLIVIDEFGKGTTEIDGQALLVGCLHHFLERGIDCPMILASTHFHQVPRILATVREDLNLLSMQRMAYVTEGEELVCLHKVENGEAGSSFTYFAAKKAGLSEKALVRSSQLLSHPENCLPNPDLKITQHMLEEIRTMKQFFDLDKEPDGISSENESRVAEV